MGNNPRKNSGQNIRKTSLRMKIHLTMAGLLLLASMNTGKHYLVETASNDDIMPPPPPPFEVLPAVPEAAVPVESAETAAGADYCGWDLTFCFPSNEWK